MDPQITKYPGVTFRLDGQDYIIPALSLRQFQENVGVLSNPIEVSAENIADLYARYVPVIGMAFRRNYPDMTDDQLMDLLDLASFPEALLAVQKANGMKAAKPGEAAPAAE